MLEVFRIKLTDRLYLVGSGQLGLSQAMDCHQYLVDCGNEYVLVDSGAGTRESLEDLRDNLSRCGLELERIGHILLTHYHCDHSGGAGKIREATGARVCMSATEKPVVEGGSREELALDWYPEDYVYHHCPVDKVFTWDNDEAFMVGDVSFVPIFTPGHSEGSVCYLAEIADKRVLFSGDTVYYGGLLGLLNFRGSELDNYRTSMPKLSGLNVDALLPGHLMITLSRGQNEIDKALNYMNSSLFVPYCVGQLGLFF